jgi:hypothetical protein
VANVRPAGPDNRYADREDNVKALTDSDPIILADIGARYEILPVKQLRMRTA